MTAPVPDPSPSRDPTPNPSSPEPSPRPDDPPVHIVALPPDSIPPGITVDNPEGDR